MSVPLAYLSVVVIWATTPLGLAWSLDSLSPFEAVFFRNLFGALLASVLLSWMGLGVDWRAAALRCYFAGSLAMFGALSLVFWGAQHIETGLISVLFGLTPILSGLFAAFLLRERELTLGKILSVLLALVGLWCIFKPSAELPEEKFLGLLAILGAMVVHALSGVLVKRFNPGLHPMVQTAGTLWVCVPMFVILGWLSGYSLTSLLAVQFSQTSALALTYLVVFGSILGFSAYFYILKHLPAAKVALITLMTPLFALGLGFWLEAERLDWLASIGALLIILALAFYQWERFILRQLGRPLALLRF